MNNPSLVGSVVVDGNGHKQPSDSEMEQSAFEHMALWVLRRRAEGKVQGLNWRGALKMWGKESTWGLRDFPFSVPSSNSRFLYLFLNSPLLLPCAAFQAATVPGQCLCLSGSRQVYPGLGEVEVSSRRWVQFWRLHWRRGLGGLGSFPESSTRVCSWHCVLSISVPRGDLW